MTMHLRRIIAFFGCLLALPLAASCAAERKSLPTPIARERIADSEIYAGPAMWEVADKDTTIYLFGTIHFLPDNVTWLSGPIEQALQSSGEIVTEIDAREEAKLTGIIANTAFLPEGENLRDRLDKADREEFESLLVSLGIPVEQFDRYKPWSAGLFLSVLMTRLAGFDPEKGVEEVVESRAPAGITHSALETVDFQINLFNSLPDEQQVAYLNQVVASAPTLKDDLSAMLDGWLKGDAEGLAKLINFEESDPALYRHMLTDRNANWAHWIENRLEQPGTVFIAVGAGHLAGKGSVQDQLKALGIKSKRVH